jgi:G:T-mismatch repair DNA endonuclease (very short patch repair protein)
MIGAIEQRKGKKSSKPDEVVMLYDKIIQVVGCFHY